MTRLLVLHGPDLNLPGTWETGVYGRVTLPQIDQALADRAADARIELATFQSNHEGALVDRIHPGRKGYLYAPEFALDRLAAGSPRG